MTVNKLTKTLLDILTARSKPKRQSWAALGENPQDRIDAEHSLITSRGNFDGGPDLAKSPLWVLADGGPSDRGAFRPSAHNNRRSWHF